MYGYIHDSCWKCMCLSLLIYIAKIVQFEIKFQNKNNYAKYSCLIIVNIVQY
jgi:hypothetical protein